MNFDIHRVNRETQKDIQNIINNKTKPPGALGQLEQLALQVALIQSSIHIEVTKPTALVFASDHGIAERGVSIASSDVTTQMVSNFLAGGAAINCFCESVDMELKVIDAGMKKKLVNEPNLINQSLGQGTSDFSLTQAMSVATAEKGIGLGASQVQALINQGCNTVALGEMGIGNTSAAAAMMCALLKLPVEQCVGRGTGIDDQQLQTKRQLIANSLELHKGSIETPLGILAAVGGFEIAQMTGGILQGAQEKIIVLIDGFIASIAALLAVRMYPEARDYLVFCHQSDELGHESVLAELDATPLLNLGMRLGEGTGAALALPLVRASCKFFNDMASFAEAGVTV
ncbi:nicotinate-nucleotide--dimethylbenzimidazole phosphoribosyltransferase [Endozoicomonas numazuensis]|uniref:Nicotinate-nucleotide--dimethylbenzimidazole phosphoribosyltransferase n=2 Tax=Endozoicomonas numazuensis TaxID=1137799 RepID=A0A081NM17_9GAMM|nr:nicotinate-nucleotide--dimethylbenzimidazole phosphoribosyltransferase [Endozoicomonas numazuensis]